VGYLVTVAIVAWCTAFAVAPPRPRHSSPRNLSFLFGFLVNELPFLAGYWLVAASALAATQGTLETPTGLVGAGIAAVTIVGLAVIVRRALRTPGANRIRPRRWVRILCWPFPRPNRGVRRIANLRYGDAGAYNLLDVYRARDRAPDGPTLVYFHGGAFRWGRKSREARVLIYRLAERGWFCISANYRLRREATFPNPLIDAKRVIAWARQHGTDFGAEPDQVFIAGSSAGGHLATTAALTMNDPAFQPGFADADTTVTAAISLYGYYGATESSGPPSSPHDYIHANAPPVFIAHGDLDTCVLVDDARAFVGALRATSASPVVYAELLGAQHDFDLFRSIRFEAVVDAIEAFTDEVMSR